MSTSQPDQTTADTVDQPETTRPGHHLDPDSGAQVVDLDESVGGDFQGQRIGVLTSGGDAQGMNAALRAVVRTAIHLGARPFAIHEGWQGAVDGGSAIREMRWGDVSDTLRLGGTIIGTARCAAFRERDGRRQAVRNLVDSGIDRLVVIGGDGSLTGADQLRAEWPTLLDELVERGELDRRTADAHPALMIAGLVGSIDNDLVGSDMTIGTDTALHRIMSALDALRSTAASHQRSFVIEVMGRRCGYLPIVAALAGGCDYVFIPEQPPGPNWRDEVCARLREGREKGRRESLVIVAEGAADQDGTPITAVEVRDVIAERLGEDTRETILGHVQRGGAPSAYDRWMSTLLGYAAAQEVLSAGPEDESVIVGVRRNRIITVPLQTAVAQTRKVGDLIGGGDYQAAVESRGTSFTEIIPLFHTLAAPSTARPGNAAVTLGRAPRIAVMHAGGLAPGMNTAAYVAARLGSAKGMEILGIDGGFPGLMAGNVEPLTWEDVEGWVGQGGAILGTKRTVPEGKELYHLARAVEELHLDGLLLIGGFNAYLGAHRMASETDHYPVFDMPIVAVPASIDNNLPGSELSIGTDTALNAVVEALDLVRRSAAATKRAFVVETMGRRCGYLAFMSGVAIGAERVYTHEDGITLDQLARDTREMVASFDLGRDIYLAIRNERANDLYTTQFLADLFAEESKGTYDVRTAVLGHIQQGGDPTAFDRLLAARLVNQAMRELDRQIAAGVAEQKYVGLRGSGLDFTPFSRMTEELDLKNRRPKDQWWRGLQPAADAVSVYHEPGTKSGEHGPVLRLDA